MDFSPEQQKIDQGFGFIAGVDEVGRGPWAGPVVAAAVILNPRQIPPGLDDSKKLTAAKRQMLAKQIYATSHVSIAQASVEEIDTLNIRQATLQAMERAVKGLTTAPHFVFVDGNVVPPNLACPAQWVVKGDSKVLSIAAASIVAKVYRDEMMAKLAETYPHYAWENNAGYGTKAHQAGLASHGVTPHHRRSFRPVANLLKA